MLIDLNAMWHFPLQQTPLPKTDFRPILMRYSTTFTYFLNTALKKVIGY